MNSTHSLAFVAALSFSLMGAPYAQSAGVRDARTTDKDMITKAADKPSKGSETATHQTDAVVKAVDPAKGNVTLAHDAIKSLNWPAMTMSFPVKDKALFDKLAVGKKVHVGITKEGADYVVTEVK